MIRFFLQGGYQERQGELVRFETKFLTSAQVFRTCCKSCNEEQGINRFCFKYMACIAFENHRVFGIRYFFQRHINCF